MSNSHKLTADLLAMRPVMEAYLKGEIIQGRYIDDETWTDIANPAWLSGRQYRVKPKPYEGWVAVYDGGIRDTSRVFDTETKVKMWLKDFIPVAQRRDWRIIFIREVK